MTTISYLTVYRDSETKSLRFAGKITDADMLRARSSPLDRKVLDDCLKFGASQSDMLLAFELIFRRIEQASEPRTLQGQLWRRQGHTVFLPHGMDPNTDSWCTGWEKLPG